MRPPRLLVVDDNRALRDVWCDALTLFGYEVVPADNGAAALALFDASPFDLVLTDLVMPGMSGWQLAEAIGRRSPVILISGSADAADIECARQQGICLLPKPLRLPDLQRVVEETLRSRHVPAS